MFKCLGTETNAIEEEQIEGSTPTTEPVTITTAEEIDGKTVTGKEDKQDKFSTNLYMICNSLYAKVANLTINYVAIYI